jgi:hypothetical protein
MTPITTHGGDRDGIIFKKLINAALSLHAPLAEPR